MSWSSRFGSWASPGRWSPFTRPEHSSQQDEEISDSDFSYITSDDVDYTLHPRNASHSHHDHSRGHSHSRSPLPHGPPAHSHTAPLRIARDTDVLILRHKKISYPVHFTAYSIDDGHLRVGDVREYAAKKLDIRDARRIRMYYKGRNLKDDNVRCCDEGLRSDAESDILVVVGAEVPASSDTRNGGIEESGHSHWHGGRGHEDDAGNDNDNDSFASFSSGSDDDGAANDRDEDGGAGGAGGAGKQRRSNRSRNKKKKNRNSTKKMSSPLPSNSTARPAGQQTVEHLPVPSGTHPMHRETSSQSQSQSQSHSTSRGPSPAGGSGPLDKLDGIASNFHTTLVPQCIQFTHSPPSDRAKREFEHKKLTETILAQVLLKLDAVETDGNDEARARRKELVKEVQSMLNRLDEVIKK